MENECPFNDNGNPCSCMASADATIKNQAKVIRSNWSELQTLKRILIDEYEDVWNQIKNKIQ